MLRDADRSKVMVDGREGQQAAGCILEACIHDHVYRIPNAVVTIVMARSDVTWKRLLATHL